MKSKTFLNNSLRSRVKGQLWIPILLAIGFFLAFPVAGIMSLENWDVFQYTAERIARCYQNLWKDGFVLTGAVITFAAAFINGVNGFWYLYSSEKVDFYHCLPVKRSQMFWEKTTAGLWYFLIPYAAMEFLAVCVGALRGYFSLALMGMALKMLFAHLVLYLWSYFCVVLAISLTGNLLMGGLMTAGIFLYGPILGYIIEASKINFFQTYTTNDFRQWVQAYPGLYFSPLTLTGIFRNEYSAGLGYWKNILLMLLLAVTVAVAAFFAYKKRPMETAGKSMVYRFAAILVEFMIVIPAGLGIGTLFYMLSNGGKKDLWYVLGLVFGTLLIHCLLQVIYQLDFRRFFNGKLQLVLAGACVVLAALVFRFDLLGYDTYLPEYEKLEKIEVDWSALSGRENVNDKYEEKDGKFERTIWWSETEKSPDLYEDIRLIVEKQEERNQGDPYENYANPITLKYTSSRGRTAIRKYWASPEEKKEILKACDRNGGYRENKYSFLQIPAEYLSAINCDYINGETYSIPQKERDALLEALKQDIEEADTETLLGIPAAGLSFNYSNVPATDEEQTDVWGYVYVYPEYERTLAILKETGYPLSMEEIDIESAKYSVLGSQVSDEEIYLTDSKSLEELKKALIPYGMDAGWIDIEDRIYVTVKIAGERNEGAYYLIKDRMPQFMKDAVEQEYEKNGEQTQDFIEDMVEAEESWID